MDITPLTASDRQVVQSYGKGQIKISGKSYAEPVMVTPDSCVEWKIDLAKFAPDGFNLALTVEDFPADKEEADVLLLGCGAKTLFIPGPLKKALRERGFSIDAMDTGAACRTYNTLMMEGRRVCAFLVPV